MVVRVFLLPVGFLLFSSIAMGTISLGSNRDIIEDVMYHAGSVVNGVVDAFNDITGYDYEDGKLVGY